MKTSNNLVFGVVYPGMEKYLKDYADSINIQDTEDFDILIINDGLKVNLQHFFRKKIIEKKILEKKHFNKIRIDGIDYAIKNNYKSIIFTDTDDYFSSDRVSKSVELLDIYDFVINRLVLVNKNGKLLENQVWDKFIENRSLNLKCFLDSNVFGLSNSAVNLQALSNIYVPETGTALDWIIISQILILGAEGTYSDAVTYYRQTPLNTVGAGIKLSPTRFLKLWKIKYEYYCVMMDICLKNKLRNAYVLYLSKQIEMEDLDDYLYDDDDDGVLKHYIDIVNNNFDKIYTGWWSEILLLEEWEKYAE